MATTTRISPIQTPQVDTVGLTVTGIPLTIPNASAVLAYDPAGTGGVGSGNLRIDANAGKGMPGFNLQLNPGDGTALHTFIRAEINLATGLPHIHLPQQLDVDGPVTAGQGVFITNTAPPQPDTSALIDFEPSLSTAPSISRLRMVSKSANATLGQFELSGASSTASGRFLSYLVMDEAAAQFFVPLQSPFYLANAASSLAIDATSTYDFLPSLARTRIITKSANANLGQFEIAAASSNADGRFKSYLVMDETLAQILLPVSITGDIVASASLTSTGIPGTIPTGNAALFFDPAGTSGNGSGDLRITGVAGKSVPAFNLLMQASDGSQFHTYLKAEISSATALPHLLVPEDLDVTGNITASVNVNAGMVTANLQVRAYGWSAFDITKSHTTIGTANDGVSPYVVLVNATAPLDQKAWVMEAQTSNLLFATESDTGVFNTWMNVARSGNGATAVTITPPLHAAAASFDTCAVNGSPVVTIATLPPGSMVYPGAGIGVSTGSAWGASIDPASLQGKLTLTTTGSSGPATLAGNTLNIPQYSGGGMVYPGTGLAVSTGSAWGASIDPLTLQGKLTLTTTGNSGAATLVGNTLNVPQYAGAAQVYPGAGVPVSTGTAWGTSIAANNIALLNANNTFTANQVFGSFNATSAVFSGSVNTGNLTVTTPLFQAVNGTFTGTLNVTGLATLSNNLSLIGGLLNLGSGGAQILGDPSGSISINSKTPGGLLLNWGSGGLVQFGNGAAAKVGSVDSAGNASFNGFVQAGPMAIGANTAFTGGNPPNLNSDGTWITVNPNGAAALYLNRTGGTGGVIFNNGAGGSVGSIDSVGNFNTNGGIHCVGAMTADAGYYTSGPKAFRIPHPLDDKKQLTHACIEGPESGVYYRGEAKLRKGSATVKLPDYFEALTYDDDRSVLLTQIIDYDDSTVFAALAASRIKGGTFLIRSNVPDARVAWEVKAVRRLGVGRLQVAVDKLKLEGPTGAKA